MRLSVVVLGLIGLAACVDTGTFVDADFVGGMGGQGATGPVAMDDGMLAYSVGVPVDTRGVHLPEGREWSVAGMGGLTCQLDMTGGFTQTDINVDMDDEDVVDGDGGHVLVMVGDQTYQMVDFPSGNFGESWSVDNGVASRLTEDGHVDLAWGDGACTVTWRGATDATVEVGPAYCANGEMVVANDGSVWVGAAESVAHVTPAGASSVAVPGHTLGFDRDTNTLVAGGSGSVAGVTPDGTVAWRVDAGGEIVGLDADAGFAGLSLEGPTANDTEMLMLDVTSGAELSRQVAQNVAPGPVVMNDRFVSVASDGHFDFFAY